MIQLVSIVSLKFLSDHVMIELYVNPFQTWHDVSYRKYIRLELLIKDGLLTNEKETQLLRIDILFLFIKNELLFARCNEYTKKEYFYFLIKIVLEIWIFFSILFSFGIEWVYHASQNFLHKLRLNCPLFSEHEKMSEFNVTTAVPISYLNLFSKIIGKPLLFNERKYNRVNEFIPSINNCNSMEGYLSISNGSIGKIGRISFK